MQAATGLQRLTLTNGLRVNLIHDPEAERAAALLQLSAGSHDEPAEWPGLAHLLEHVLFAGSEGYQGDRRLMAWGPASGARLNATTQAHHTAWFFDSAPDKFEQGLLRLADMLARPLLTAESVAQETAVIDAEFQMLSRHADTLCEAALSQAFTSPHRLHDFHVGNLAAFGENRAPLQQALRDWHRVFFRAENLEMWLQGPQPMDRLAELAEQIGMAFSPLAAEAKPAELPLILNGCRHYGLRNTSAERLLLSFLVTGGQRQRLSVLRELLTDRAAHSLLATLREQGLCDALQLLEPYRSPQQSLISVQFTLCEGASPAAVEAVFSRWLSQLAGLSASELAHYAGQARRQFAHLSGLDQLRARAFGFSPSDEEAVGLSEGWQALVAQLRPGKMTRLWVAPSLTASQQRVQGFSLQTGEVAWPASIGYTGPEMTFYAAARPLPRPSLPQNAAPLSAVPALGQPLLLISPPAGQSLSRQSAALMEAALQPVIGLCQHHGGELSFSQQQGSWLLQLSGTPELIASTLSAAIDALIAPPAAVIAQGKRLYRQFTQSQRAEIAVRALLSHLPDLLTEETPHAPQRWQATLYGGDADLYQHLSRLLSRWPGKCVPPPQAPAHPLPDRHEYAFPTAGQDAAALLFCPLAENSAECFAAWQLLAALFEPRFFQKLRVELNIGYAVSCRFHFAAGVAGILFALQSPKLTSGQLCRHIADFIGDMSGVIAKTDDATLSERAAALSHALPLITPKTHANCLQHWQQRQLALPISDVDIYAAHSVEKLQRYYRLFIAEKQRWWRLTNAK